MNLVGEFREKSTVQGGEQQNRQEIYVFYTTFNVKLTLRLTIIGLGGVFRLTTPRRIS